MSHINCSSQGLVWVKTRPSQFTLVSGEPVSGLEVPSGPIFLKQLVEKWCICCNLPVPIYTLYTYIAVTKTSQNCDPTCWISLSSMAWNCCMERLMSKVEMFVREMPNGTTGHLGSLYCNGHISVPSLRCYITQPKPHKYTAGIQSLVTSGKKKKKNLHKIK